MPCNEAVETTALKRASERPTHGIGHPAAIAAASIGMLPQPMRLSAHYQTPLLERGALHSKVTELLARELHGGLEEAGEGEGLEQAACRGACAGGQTIVRVGIALQL